MENAMELPIFQLDAFATRLFGGNPAAVVILPEWLPDDVLQQIAMENNLSETAFVVPGGDAFGLRWFTPEVEVDLCGHATRPPKPIRCDASLIGALGATPREAHQSRDLLAVFGTQAEVEALQPDLPAIAELDTFAVIASAPGQECDFVSRFFAPGAGVPEDPATGSAHCTLVPYWSERLGKKRLHALQLSRRVGELFCEIRDSRVKLSGRVVEYLRGRIYL
jgi:predicted PhzF superfamily epimerase YddE/YHI9